MESMRPRPKWNESWQKEFLEIKKAHKPDEIRILMEGPKGFEDAYKLNFLYKEYKRLKKRQEDEEQ